MTATELSDAVWTAYSGDGTKEEKQALQRSFEQYGIKPETAKLLTRKFYGNYRASCWLGTAQLLYTKAELTSYLTGLCLRSAPGKWPKIGD